MRNMFEFNISLLYWIFFIMAFGFLVLTLPMGLFFTWWSRKLAVQR
jgi:glutamate transport system permease protein